MGIPSAVGQLRWLGAGSLTRSLSSSRRSNPEIPPLPKSFLRQYGLDISAIYAAGITRALVHSTAQRFARVRVAEMQLYQASQVKSGRENRDLYGALAPAIDAARGAFRERFLLPLDGIPDYLHQELVRTLAKEDAVLLGPSYPGPQA